MFKKKGQPRPTMITIHSVRGGTGKTNLSANLAASFALNGSNTLIVDLDLPSPSQYVLFDVPTAPNINQFFAGRKKLLDCCHKATNRLWVIPASPEPEEIARISNIGYDKTPIKSLFQALPTVIKKYNIHVIIFDSHPGINTPTLTAHVMSDFPILIIRPDQQDYTSAHTLIEILKTFDIKPKIIINKNYGYHEQLISEDAADQFSADCLQVFPLYSDILKHGSKGLFILENKSHPFTEKINELRLILTQEAVC